jgi:hypothetical protein
VNGLTIHDLGGGLLFAGVVIGAVTLARWLARAMIDYEPHCVYKIPLMDGRWYYGYAKDPDKRLRWHRQHQKGLPEGHPRKWWPQVPLHVQKSMHMPEEWVTWYRSKEVAEQVERREIRAAEAGGVIVLANRIKYKGEIDDAA